MGIIMLVAGALMLMLFAAALLLAGIVQLVGELWRGGYCHECGRLVHLWRPRTAYGIQCLRCSVLGRPGSWRRP